MDIHQLHPELHKAFRRIPALPLHNRFILSLLQNLQKLMPTKAKAFASVDVKEQTLNSGKVRIYQPHVYTSGAGLLWIHGGGYIIGNAAINDRECLRLARDLNLLVVSVDYRLAPGHPFPAALDDCFDAWQWMQKSAAQWQLNPGRIAIMGQSAGGGLAATLAQRIADSDSLQPAAQVLMYPMLDDRTGANTSLDQLQHPLWNNKNNRAAWHCYLNQPAGGETNPQYAVAARATNLSTLPITWIGVGELDLFFEEDQEYASRLKNAGVSCEFHIAPKAPHAYDLIVPESSVSKNTIDSYLNFLRRHLQLT